MYRVTRTALAVGANEGMFSSPNPVLLLIPFELRRIFLLVPNGDSKLKCVMVARDSVTAEVYAKYLYRCTGIYRVVYYTFVACYHSCLA